MLLFDMGEDHLKMIDNVFSFGLDNCVMIDSVCGVSL